MKRLTQFHRFFTLGLLATTIFILATACTTPDSVSDESAELDDFSSLEQASAGESPESSIESELAGDTAAGGEAAGGGDFDEFSEPDQSAQANSGPDFELEPSTEGTVATEPQMDPPAEAQPPAEPPFPIDSGEPVMDPPVAESPMPSAPEVALEETAPASTAGQSGKTVNLTNIDYRANDAGGTVVVAGSGPMSFTTRKNEQTRQFVVEIPNSKLPRKLQRPFNTKDIAGTIGAIDAYQYGGSTTSRIVLQLREGAPDPIVQAEENTVLIVAQGGSQAPEEEGEGDIEAEAASAEEAANTSGILSSDSLEQFLSTNQKFYGKRISVETDEAELRDVIKFIAEEANVNLVMSSDVRGKTSVKLKNVPWDQAVVTLLKANKLGYTRVGSVIRVAPLKEIKDEEDAAMERRQRGPQMVKTISVNYSKVEDVEKQVKTVLSQKGTVVADARTSTIVISDFDENISRATQLIQALDIAPSQVLIEGKIVEASEEFENQLGFNWSATGKPTGRGPRSQLGLSLSPGFTKSSALFNLRMGTFDVLGDLTSALALYENQGVVNILSSPRIVSLHNEEAEINQKVQVPTDSVTDLPGGGQRLSVQYVDVKLRLFVKPQVTNDGSVIMNVDVNRDIQGPSLSGSKTGAPAINSKSAKSKVLVRNGQTAVIGGIYQNDDSKSETKVPGLGDIPVIGWLFKSTAKVTRRNELLIFLTPRILAKMDSPLSTFDPGGTSPAAPAGGDDFGGEF